MKKIALFVLLFFFVGTVGAVTVSNVSPVYNMGHSGGDNFLGTVKATYFWSTGDAWIQDDLKVTDDAEVDGDLSVTGIGSFTGGTIISGVYDGNFRLAATHWLYSTAGAGGLDFSNATSFFNTSTGPNYLNGDVIQASGKNFTQQGAATFTSGTGVFDINGATTTKAITQDSTSDFAQQGHAKITVGSEGITAVSSPLNVLENLAMAADKSIVLSGTGGVSSAAAIKGEDLESTDDAYVKDDFVVDGAARVDEALTTNSGVINTTLDVNGASTLAGLTMDSGTALVAGPIKYRTTTTATNVTVSDTNADVYFVGNSTNPNSQTIIFPTAADNTGRVILVMLKTDPGSNTVVIDGEGGEQIDGANTKTTTDAVGSFYYLICDGTAWRKLASSGTWT